MNETTLLSIIFSVCALGISWAAYMWYQLYRRKKDIEKYAEERRRERNARLAEERRAEALPRYYDQHVDY